MTLPADRLPDRRHRRPEGRRAGAPPGAPWRRGRLGPGAVARPEPGGRRVAAGGHRGRAGPAGRPVPRDDRHRDAGVVRRGRVLGRCCPTSSRRWRPPRSWPAARRASVRCGAAGCASCGRRTPSASTTSSPTCAAGTLAGKRIVVQEHGQSLSMVAHALRRQGADVTTVTVYRVASAEDPGPMFHLVDLVADRALQAVTFTSAPAVAAMMEAAGLDRPPRRAGRRLPGRRRGLVRRAGHGRRVRDVGRADDLPRPLAAGGDGQAAGDRAAVAEPPAPRSRSPATCCSCTARPCCWTASR